MLKWSPRAIASLLLLLPVACAGAQAAEVNGRANGQKSRTEETARANAPSGRPKAEAVPKAKARGPARRAEAATPGAAPKASKPKEDPNACPAGMKLVEGDYCSEVEHECVRSWFDKSNKKTICEKFREGSAKCVGTSSKKRFCIDTYAWPNKVGERPEVMNRFHQAEVKCAAVGKRMCTESEWTFACEGQEMKPFPYGYERDTKKCHGDMPWDSPKMPKVAQRDEQELSRLWKGVRNGSQPQCVSDFGVYDLPGNTDDVVSSETYSDDFRGKFDSVHTGGPWYKGVRNQCRPKIYTHNEDFYYYFLGFRCCAEADAAPTDPRTPKQIKEGWDFKRVEKSAGFTREQYQALLKLKEEHPDCLCKPKDKKCRTLCGTLLGPDAKDFKP
ncbi:MAG: SUMF1/EgtB/PvdO family nonheme iron enzyme [Polyangiaceae bacterium]|nr:SUMF1/EgtB/PvdO family nonheme iron enzyme [Polyangiaceae bacterium]